MHAIKRFVVLGLILVALLLGYTKVMARIGSGIAPDLEQPDRQADLITVDKRQRRMVLWRQGESLAEYRISLGGAGDEGHKQREGDQRTPEGRYLIDWRNPKSMAHLSLHISYPNEQDEARARAAGYAPGGNIMIHGLANGWGWLGPLHHLWDWTDGCIAVRDDEMRQIWALVPNGTPIEIRR
ncbi:L,D-transpeptidase family protein [Ectopseudomonas guguanensis]|uniref:L,D-transpeptidase catalytic domain n=1 Tax=Ectopseudomonas guguanensis TaxID=1198456 RepID=A0A1H0NP54_9GAMM|nr:L,D-transpeptidase family protein [Pseudomonas guguanensis]SDO94328.1 L,D-transpeptidase catalytic domain [Pseudomonas guguanensis]